MKHKKVLLYFPIVALLILSCVIYVGITLIGNNVSKESGGVGIVGDGSNVSVDGASVGTEVTCIVGDSNCDYDFDVRDLVRLERWFADDSTVTTCSLDGDCNVSGALITEDGNWDTEDAERCLQMLVEDPPSLQFTANQTNYNKEFQDLDCEYAYYTLNKALKQGWMLKFKIEFIENTGCSVSAYYPGCDEWLDLEVQDDENYVIVATEDIDVKTLKIRVSYNTENLAESAFRVYDIQVIKHTYVTGLNITYDGELQIPIVYDTESFDMTKFAVSPNDEEIEYDWELRYNGVLVSDFGKNTTEYHFSEPGTYTLTAKGNKTDASDIPNLKTANYSCEVSTTITVLDSEVYENNSFVVPDVEVNYDDGKIQNTGFGNAAVGVYQLSDAGTEFTDYTDTVNYTTGVYGEKDGAIITNHANAPYTVIKDYAFNNGNFTISTWFNIPDIDKISDETYAYLFGTATPTASGGFSAVVTKDGTLQLYVNGQSTSVENLTIKENSWYHLVARCSDTALEFYLNGANDGKIFTVQLYDTRDIAFGAYTGLTAANYANNEVYFDDIEVYKTAITETQIKNMYASADRVPDVYVDFENNTVENDGRLKDIQIRSCKLLDDARTVVQQQATMFGAQNPLEPNTNSETQESFDNFSTSSDDGSASNTMFRDGLYTVARDYVFGKDNFTVSTRFCMPVVELYNSAAVYLFGTNHPDAEDGIALGLKKSDTNTQQIRVKILDEEYWINLGLGYAHPEIVQGTWYDIAFTREGDSMKVYLNDTLLRTFAIPEDYDYGTTDLSFGGYYGFQYQYQGKFIHFDDINVYEGARTSSTAENATATNLIEPDVEITYTDGSIENTGLDRRVTVGAYELDVPEGNSTQFDPVETTVDNYTTGLDGNENGAILTNHKNGPYTVVNGYDFGTDNFTISTWFNVPTKMSLGHNSTNANGTYIMGTSKVDDTADGFRITLRRNADDNKFEFQFRAEGSEKTDSTLVECPDFEYGKWNNLVVVRKGNQLTMYANGTFVQTITLSDNFSFGSKALSLGAYFSEGWSYLDANIYYDDVRIYREALEESYIVNVAQIGMNKNTWLQQGRSGETTLFIGDDFFTADSWTTFDTTYTEKDVLLAGIKGSTIQDWGILIDRYLAHTRPKNLVVHLGTNDIHNKGDNAETVISNLQSLFTQIHGLENYEYTKIYYFGIPTKDNSTETEINIINEVNEAMSAWCSEEGQQSWIIYINALSSDDSYDQIAEKLNNSGINIKSLPTGTIPKVEITYSGGKIVNIGTDRTLTVGAYKLDKVSGSTGFVETTVTDTDEKTNFTTGIEGDVNGALITNNQLGPYTVVNGYDFGTNDFTISTWFKIPTGSLDTGNGTYIMGTCQPDDTSDGFRITLRRNTDDNKYEFQFKAEGKGLGTNNDLVECPEFAYDKWIHLVVVRDGNQLTLYANGTSVQTITLSDDFSFGSKALSFGAYWGFGTGYANANMYYDDICIYEKALESSEILEKYNLITSLIETTDVIE